VADARRLGVKILPLDINKSSDSYTVEDGAIRISLRQLKGMSEDTLESILSARAEGKFISLRDFVLRTKVNRPILENLVRVGAFDSFGSRKELLLQIPQLADLKRKVNRRAIPLFEDTKSEVNLPEEILDDGRKARMLVERELLSLDLSAHPLDFYPFDSGVTKMKDLPSISTGKVIKIVGSVIRYQTPRTRNGKRIVYVIMEDGTGIADVIVFSDVQEKCGQVFFREGWLMVRGKVQRRGQKAVSIIAEHLSPLNTRGIVSESC